MWDKSRYLHPQGVEEKEEVTFFNRSIKQVFYTLGTHKCECRWRGNVHAHTGTKSPVKGNHSTTVPGKHSNDRLTVPAQNGMARNSVLQSHCPEYSKEKHDVHIDIQPSLMCQ